MRVGGVPTVRFVSFYEVSLAFHARGRVHTCSSFTGKKPPWVSGASSVATLASLEASPRTQSTIHNVQLVVNSHMLIHCVSKPCEDLELCMLTDLCCRPKKKQLKSDVWSSHYTSRLITMIRTWRQGKVKSFAKGWPKPCCLSEIWDHTATGYCILRCT